MNVASKESWKNSPMPDKNAELPFVREFSIQELEAIKIGIIPQEMEDKWFIYFNDNIIHFHRSWTGMKVFEVHLNCSANDHATISKCIVNRDSTEYSAVNENADIDLLNYLIDRLLLSHNVDFPESNSINQFGVDLSKHHVVGYGRSNKEQN